MNYTMKGWVTINTDASFRPDYKLASFAYWIRYEGAKYCGAGVVKTKLYSPNQAERAAVANALHIILSEKIVPIKIIINCDNLSAGVIKKKGDDTHKAVHRLLKELWRRSKQNGFDGVFESFFEFRHVKAHSGTDEKRKWVNDWCDKQAKKVLREHISNLK